MLKQTIQNFLGLTQGKSGWGGGDNSIRFFAPPPHQGFKDDLWKISHIYSPFYPNFFSKKILGGGDSGHSLCPPPEHNAGLTAFIDDEFLEVEGVVHNPALRLLLTQRQRGIKTDNMSI